VGVLILLFAGDRQVLCKSTVGEAPDTITDSSSDPTFMSMLTVAVKSLGS